MLIYIALQILPGHPFRATLAPFGIPFVTIVAPCSVQNQLDVDLDFDFDLETFSAAFGSKIVACKSRPTLIFVLPIERECNVIFCFVFWGARRS